MNASVQQAVWRKRGCCLVGHLAEFWEFCSRPSLTDTPACRQAAKTLSASSGQRSETTTTKHENKKRWTLN